MGEWKFKPFAQDDTMENPTQSQFFTTEEVGNMANGVVREGIQNALDERLDPQKPVAVSITLLTNQHALEPRVYGRYLQGLIPHLSSKDSGLRIIPDFSRDKMNVLIFEDFNTNGLRGNPLESSDDEIQNRNKKHNFYYFWRNVGITGKPEDKLGRWGIGKTVFPASSRINTFFGFTIQEDTKQALLLGQSILKKHNLVDNPRDWGYRPYGYFGKYLTNNFFVTPLDEEKDLDHFKKIFCLKRNSEPGLSLVVPFFHEDITSRSLVYAVISQYFFPIIKGNLKVTIADSEKSYSIDGESLQTLVHQLQKEYAENGEQNLDWENLLRLFEFTKWCITLEENNLVALSPPDPRNTPAWYEKLWTGLDIDQLILKFEVEQRIGFKVPVKYQNREHDKEPILRWFKVFLQKDEKVKRAENHFIRQNITIIDVKSLEAPCVRGVVLIDDKDLSNLLGDSENPAHTQWQKDSLNFKNKYFDGEKCIQFIINSLYKIFYKLQRPAKGIDKEILLDYFYTPTEEQASLPLQPEEKPGGNNTNVPEIPKIQPTSKKIKVERIPGGFAIKGDEGDKKIGFEVHVQVAYLTSRGKPLKKYEPLDFEINKPPIEVKRLGIEVLANKMNAIVFKVVKQPFELKVAGFDKNRDLFINAITKSGKNDQEV